MELAVEMPRSWRERYRRTRRGRIAPSGNQTTNCCAPQALLHAQLGRRATICVFFAGVSYTRWARPVGLNKVCRIARTPCLLILHRLWHRGTACPIQGFGGVGDGVPLAAQVEGNGACHGFARGRGISSARAVGAQSDFFRDGGYRRGTVYVMVRVGWPCWCATEGVC